MAAFNLIVFFHALLLSVLLVALSKERLELEQRMKAQTDPLTGALNRRAFVARGTRLAQRHCHERAPLCLLFLDLDHFKSLNDRLGHSGGDDVLMRFVAVVHDNIRPTDFLFRIGGEEFCCLLPHTRADQAHTVAERIRHQFESAIIDVAGIPVKATVSIGIASTETFGYDLDTLMRKADMAVYAAKRQGRNRVVIAAPMSPQTPPQRHDARRPHGAGGVAARARSAQRLRRGAARCRAMPMVAWRLSLRARRRPPWRRPLSASLPIQRAVLSAEAANLAASFRAAVRSAGFFLPPIARSAQFTPFFTKFRSSVAAASISGSRFR